MLLREVKGKVDGNNSCSFISDTAFGLDHLRITATDPNKHHSEKIDYPAPKKVEIKNGLTVSYEC